jgi:hypothetical protein
MTRSRRAIARATDVVVVSLMLTAQLYRELAQSALTLLPRRRTEWEA